MGGKNGIVADGDSMRSGERVYGPRVPVQISVISDENQFSASAKVIIQNGLFRRRKRLCGCHEEQCVESGQICRSQTVGLLDVIVVGHKLIEQRIGVRGFTCPVAVVIWDIVCCPGVLFLHHKNFDVPASVYDQSG